eukprot:365363-Chlamydomonas_euryale.AAC.7
MLMDKLFNGAVELRGVRREQRSVLEHLFEVGISWLLRQRVSFGCRMRRDDGHPALLGGRQQLEHCNRSITHLGRVCRVKQRDQLLDHHQAFKDARLARLAALRHGPQRVDGSASCGTAPARTNSPARAGLWRVSCNTSPAACSCVALLPAVRSATAGFATPRPISASQTPMALSPEASSLSAPAACACCPVQSLPSGIASNCTSGRSAPPSTMRSRRAAELPLERSATDASIVPVAAIESLRASLPPAARLHNAPAASTRNDNGSDLAHSSAASGGTAPLLAIVSLQCSPLLANVVSSAAARHAMGSYASRSLTRLGPAQQVKGTRSSIQPPLPLPPLCLRVPVARMLSSVSSARNRTLASPPAASSFAAADAAPRASALWPGWMSAESKAPWPSSGVAALLVELCSLRTCSAVPAPQNSSS